MIDSSEALLCAEELSEFCREMSGCNNCPFSIQFDVFYDCAVNTVPSFWQINQLDELREQAAKESQSHHGKRTKQRVYYR